MDKKELVGLLRKPKEWVKENDVIKHESGLKIKKSDNLLYLVDEEELAIDLSNKTDRMLESCLIRLFILR